MKKQNIAQAACTGLLLSTALTLPAYAGEKDSNTAAATDTSSATSQDAASKLEREASDAWREGKLDTIYLFNQQLNNFTIDPEVRGASVVLTGKVESEVDKELAEQIALGLDGISEVTNRLTVVPAEEARAGTSDSDRAFSDKVEDATLTAQVKTKLLANGARRPDRRPGCASVSGWP